MCTFCHWYWLQKTWRYWVIISRIPWQQCLEQLPATALCRASPRQGGTQLLQPSLSTSGPKRSFNTSFNICLSLRAPQASEVTWPWETMVPLQRQRVRCECLGHQHETSPRSSTSELKPHQPIAVNAFPEGLVPWYSSAQQHGRMPQMEPMGVWLDWIPQGGITADVFDEEIYSCTGCSQSPHLPPIFF